MYSLLEWQQEDRKFHWAFYVALGTSAGKLDHAPNLWDKSQLSSVLFLKNTSVESCSKEIKMSSSVLVTVFQQHPKEFFKGKQAVSRMRKMWHREVSWDACGHPDGIAGSKAQFSWRSFQALTMRRNCSSQPLILRPSTGAGGAQLLAEVCFFSCNRRQKIINFSKPLSSALLLNLLESRCASHEYFGTLGGRFGAHEGIMCFEAWGSPSLVCCKALKLQNFSLSVNPPGFVHWYSPPSHHTDVTLCTEFQLAGRGYGPCTEIL